MRSDSINIALFVHVLGAMVLVGGLRHRRGGGHHRLEATRAAALRRFSYWTLLAVAFPGYIVMRVGAQWVESKEHLDNLPDDPAWLGIGYITADGGRSAPADRADPRRHRDPQVARRAAAAGCSRRAALIATLLVAAYVVTDLGDGREADLGMHRQPRIVHSLGVQSKITGRESMALQLGDTAPDFEADTTEGRIKFHDWLGDSWAVMFSHPRNFTPVCTTELGYMASIEPEFARRGVKIIGLSVDPVEQPRAVGEGHRGDAGHRAQLPAHRRRRLQRLEALRHAPAPTSRATRRRARRPTTRPCATSS